MSISNGYNGNARHETVSLVYTPSSCQTSQVAEHWRQYEDSTGVSPLENLCIVVPVRHVGKADTFGDFVAVACLHRCSAGISIKVDVWRVPKICRFLVTNGVLRGLTVWTGED